MKLPLLAALGGASLAFVAACASDPDPALLVTPPLVTPPPITAADGTVIPLPAHVADGATDAQRDAYADQVLASERISGQRDNARAACAIMDSGSVPVLAIATLGYSMPPDVAAKVSYTGVLSYCPAHRAAFDNLEALRHGGLASNPAQPSPAPIQVDPQLFEPQTTEPTTTTTTRRSTRTSTPARTSESGTSSGESQFEWGCQQGYITEGC